MVSPSTTAVAAPVPSSPSAGADSQTTVTSVVGSSKPTNANAATLTPVAPPANKISVAKRTRRSIAGGSAGSGIPLSDADRGGRDQNRATGRVEIRRERVGPLLAASQTTRPIAR
jgi:hypothetical protein